MYSITVYTVHILLDQFDDLLQVPPVSLQGVLVNLSLHVSDLSGAGPEIERVEWSASVDTAENCK